jgi:hypothetical protein
MALEGAVAEALEHGIRTPDVAVAGHEASSTQQMGDAVLGRIRDSG